MMDGEDSGRAIGHRHGRVGDDCETNGCKRVTYCVFYMPLCRDSRLLRHILVV